jgi:catechol 2,3-dioxygenase-like lactoylglutathione lyase family enzyme
VRDLEQRDHLAELAAFSVAHRRCGRALLPAIGFTEYWEGETWRGNSAVGAFPSKPFFGFTEDPHHQPNGTRIAFWVSSPAEVDRVGGIIRQAGAKNIEGPLFNPEDNGTYYAVFFEDPSGNRLEVVHRQK